MTANVFAPDDKMQKMLQLTPFSPTSGYIFVVLSF